MKPAVIVPVFALLSGAIAWGVLSGARDARLEALLEEIEAAETRAAYVGTREIQAGESFVVRIASAGDGRRHVEAAGPRPRRPAFAAVLPPGLVHGQERVRDFRLAVRNYEIVGTGPARVAGRDADTYEARPRHPGRPSFRVAADRVHRLALRFEVVAEGKTRFRAEFKEIRFAAPSEIRLPEEKPSAPSWLRVSRSELPAGRLSEAAGFGVWLPSRLPAGFELKSAERIRLDVDLPESARRALPIPLPKLGGTIAHVAYSDGLAQLSLLQVDARSEFWAIARRFLPKEREASEGILARRVKGPGGWAYLLEVEGTAVLAAGNASAEEIERTIESLRRR